MSKFVFVFRYFKDNKGKLWIHTGGPFINAYWFPTAYKSLEQMKTTYRKQLKGEQIRFIQSRKGFDKF